MTTESSAHCLFAIYPIPPIIVFLLYCSSLATLQKIVLKWPNMDLAITTQASVECECFVTTRPFNYLKAHQKMCEKNKVLFSLSSSFFSPVT